jgi:hypothetical protein
VLLQSRRVGEDLLLALDLPDARVGGVDLGARLGQAKLHDVSDLRKARLLLDELRSSILQLPDEFARLLFFLESRRGLLNAVAERSLDELLPGEEVAGARGAKEDLHECAGPGPVDGVGPPVQEGAGFGDLGLHGALEHQGVDQA